MNDFEIFSSPLPENPSPCRSEAALSADLCGGDPDSTGLKGSVASS